MSPPTRRSMLVALGGTLSTAGCLTDVDSESAPDTTDDPATGTTTNNPATSGDVTQGANEPESDHQVTLNNDSSQTRTVRVWVVRKATDETVFEETREVSPGREIELYNLTQADPDGIEAFSICGELVGESDSQDCATLRTDACHGLAHVTVQEDGAISVIYSVC